jgi:outer membrane protein assembly factor BamB/tRNA A-37 threonylcarbamoyl transferase component Bud32
MGLDTKNITQGMNDNKEPKQQLAPGTLLANRYEIQDVIGVGGMGSVYRARDMHFPNVKKIVAVKEMIVNIPDPLVRKTIFNNFEREANILVTLSHTSIPNIFDYFSEEERSYLVLEYIHGKDLEEIITSNSDFINENMVINWAIELCDVLQYLHTHKPEPIVFRDIKPSNIMINEQNHVVLIDFGIAKLFKGGQKGTMIGTEGYSPPEQYRGEASPKVDIYALGATLHHILTKHDPRLETPFTFSERPIRSINPGISIQLETVVNTALQYNPEERFESASVMKEALISVAKQTGMLNIASVYSIENSNESIIKPLWSFRCEDEIRGTPTIHDGILYVGAYDNNLYAINAENGKFIWKMATDGGIVTKPAIQESTVFFGSEDNQLYAISSRTGRLLWVFNTGGPIRSSPVISEGHIFVGSDDGFLYAVNIESNRRTWRVDAGSPIRSTPFVHRGNIYIGCESGEFLCVNYRGQVKWRFTAKKAITSSPALLDKAIYFTSLDSTLYALDANSGWALWRFRMEKGSISSPFVEDESVFVGSADGNIYCVDTERSKEIWSYQTETQVSGSPIVFKDSVFCGTADGYLYCLDKRKGSLIWRFETGGPITGRPVVYRDKIIFGSCDHKIYGLLA